MLQFHKETIKNVFSTKYGLKDCLKNGKTRNDALISLAKFTGFRIDFLKENLDEILEIN